ncbi:O-antigen polymerase [Janthinobacterium sp.]|uniref:O-antigen polymerase n=1 Tax=Janthinobacterium sp. TaxID=1871054 RepID=UPI0025C31486|nr:O-antigen polymerase [Janthinobacterium sp.]NBV16349.1 oligosaccharide repeat unit polymerase [Janthinobacterium sp.]
MHQNSIALLIFLSTFVFGLIIYGIKLYKTPLNPLTFYLALDSGLRVILSCSLIFFTDTEQNFNDADIVDALLLHLLYVSCFALPFILRPRWLLRAVDTIRRAFFLSMPRSKTPFSVLTLFVIIAFICFNFFMLMIAGDGGMLWITDPREAYQNYKFGAGNYYLFWVWSISFFTIYVLYSTKARTKKDVLKISPLFLVIFVLTYFTGSKQIFFVNILLILFYYTHYIKLISVKFFTVIGLTLFGLFLGLQLLQGTTSNLIGALSYFDYFQKSIEFVAQYNNIGPTYGDSFISSFWGYVPRSFAPDKPLIYGQLMIQDFLYPGAAEVGYYPAFASWTFLYLDFWVFGVIISGFFVGGLSWALYELFRRNSDDIFLFSMAAQAAITIYMVPLHGELYIFFWFILQRIILNIHFKRTR